MWDALYNVWWMNGFLRYVGTVPISATRAKDAVRTVATALKEGGLVCLFPEGEITRHGMVNELRKGFELMARQGEAKVMPVWLDGLYGSIFSFQGGHFFKKRPKQFRYPATVFFGEPLEAKAGNAAAVRRAMLAMSEQALLAREVWKLAGEDRTAFLNALRLREAEWHRPGDVLLCLEPAGSVVHRLVRELARLLPGTKIIEAMVEAGGGPVVAFGSLASLSKSQQGERLFFCFDADAAQIMALQAPKALRGYFDAASGVLVSAEVPNPPAAEGEECQHGTRAGTLGRLLFSGDDVRKAVKVISGGEQGRMIFGKLMLMKCNVLVLDEPTNHLDMESIESLNTALEKFKGTLVFASHDREFVSSLATRVLEVRIDGTVVNYLGNYEEYLASQGID